MEDDLKKNEMEDDLKKWKTTSKKWKHGRQTQVQVKKSTLIGCDIVVN